MENYIQNIYFINKEECNKSFTEEKAIEIILYKLLLNGQKNRITIDKENRIIKVDLDKKYICQVKYEEVKDDKNIIKEYRKDKIKLIKAELIKR